MSFRDELEGIEARIREIDAAIADRDRTIGALGEKLGATVVGERHAIQIRQLETALLAARSDLDRLRLRAKELGLDRG